jgi:hypothetical protein
MVCCWNTIFIKQYYLVFFLTLWVSLWLKILILSVPLCVELILVREIIFIYLLFTSYISMELIVNFWIFSNTLFREFSWYQWGESPNYQYDHINCSTGVCVLIWISHLVHSILLAVSLLICAFAALCPAYRLWLVDHYVSVISKLDYLWSVHHIYELLCA